MGREVKRVPIDFSWPVGKIWPGYLISTCPSEHITCEECRAAAVMRGMKMTTYDCPDYSGITDPPKGDAWQMWENTSEGSPISPPCATPEDLARWLADNNASSFGSQTATYEQWLAMIMQGWAVSAVLVDGNMVSGVEAASCLTSPTQLE